MVIQDEHAESMCSFAGQIRSGCRNKQS